LSIDFFSQALAGKLDGDKQFRGDIKYNGLSSAQAKAKGLHVNKLCAFVDQGDVHLPFLTVQVASRSPSVPVLSLRHRMRFLDSLQETLKFAVDNAVADPALLNNEQISQVCSSLSLEFCPSADLCPVFSSLPSDAQESR
jgi:hypothetical protein